MMCILEVYTQNRNEDDFLENLGIIGELLREKDDNDIYDNESDINRNVDFEFT
jgi:hypothetical protein